LSGVPCIFVQLRQNAEPDSRGLDPSTSGRSAQAGLASVDARLKAVGDKVEMRPVKHVALSYEGSYSMPMRSRPLRRLGLHLYAA
jgi:hypothetical protein